MSDLEARLKATADADAKAGRIEAALEGYNKALSVSPLCSTLLCNRSLMAVKLGKHKEALDDAVCGSARFRSSSCSILFATRLLNVM